MSKNLVVTFQNENNYGAVLQAYALQSYLESIGRSTDICNLSFKLNPKSIWIDRTISLLRTIRFALFRKKYLNLTKKVSNAKIFDNLADSYQNIIVGSDQVFSLDIMKQYSDIFFLDIHNRNKFSYAASFGNNENISANISTIKNLLDSFRQLSFREKSALNILRQAGIYGEHHIDPTFLLEKDSYIKKFGLSHKSRDKYILVYMPTIDESIVPLVTKIQDITGFNIICLNNKNRFGQKAKCKPNASPKQFLELIYNAEIVITNSFHGTCFSIIFNKPFICVPHQGKETRQIDLLESIGLSKHIYEKEQEISSYLIPPAVDRIALSKLVSRSRKYLCKITENRNALS